VHLASSAFVLAHAVAHAVAIAVVVPELQGAKKALARI